MTPKGRIGQVLFSEDYFRIIILGCLCNYYLEKGFFYDYFTLKATYQLSNHSV